MKGNATSSVLLIEMPFSIPLAPNPALPLLKGYLQAHGIQTDCKYWGRELFKMNRQCNFLPASTYVTLIDVPLLVGDLIFGSWLFPECHIEFEKEVGKLLSGYGIPENDKIEGLLTFEKELKKIVSRWLKEIECGNYSLIGFTITTGQLLPSLYLAKRIKAQGCQVPIVFGGSLCSKEMGISILRNFDFVDLVVDGEGEVTLCELAKKANNGEDLRGIAGTFHRSDNGKVVVNPPRPPIEDLDALPFPDYSEFFEKYCGAKDRYDIDVPIWGSRGCSWNHCTFCENIGSWGRHRARSPENIVQELLFLNETYKVSNFLFYDNSLNPKGSYFEHLCDLLIEIDRDFRLVGELRATGLTKELLKKAYRAGFTEFQIGVEALDNDLLKKMGKGTKVMDNVKALRWTSQVGITLQYNLISNFPTETKQSVENTWVVFNKVKHLGMPKISPFCTLYGSPIYRDPEKFNTNIGEPASHLSRWFP
nr:RiPP maturation radical SAM protein 1 [Desulfobacterales bacterium]